MATIHVESEGPIPRRKKPHYIEKAVLHMPVYMTEIKSVLK